MFVLTALTTAALATGGGNKATCEGYIQLNHDSVVEAHPYGSPNMTVQFGNTGGAVCSDVTVACHITNNDGGDISNIHAGPYHGYNTWNNGTRSGFNTNGYGIDINPGQNYNVSFTANVGTHDERVVCKLFVDGVREDLDRVDIEIIPC